MTEKLYFLKFILSKHFFGCLVALLLCSQLQAQDPVFSQFYSAPLQLNPAFAGNTYGPLININYRNQWSSIPTAYATYAVSYDQFFEGLNSGFGFAAMSDDAGQGLYSINRFTGVFSYKVQVNREFAMKLGVEAGAIQTVWDWDSFIFYDQIDPIEGPTNPSGGGFPTDENRPDQTNRTFLDISTGILAYSKTFYGGVSLKHINTPDDNYLDINNNLNSGWPMRFTAHGGAQFTLIEGNKRTPTSFISPNVMYIRQRDFAQLNVGAYASLGVVFAGAWYRQASSNSDAVIFLAGLQKGIFKFGYSYDLTISSLENSVSGGSHEISFTLNLDANRPRRVDYNDCFQMFR